MLVVVRLRLPGRLAVAAALSVLAAGVTATPHRALAQSFFDQLFGSFTPRHQAMPESRPAMKSIAGPPIRLQSSRPQADDAEPSERGRHSDRDRHTGRYRTVCVRTCDGFYFPISHTASRSDLSADADVCRSRCGGSEARLFYHPNSGEIGDGVDLTGRSYKSLSNAFLFRKKLVDGCTCKPMPWSPAEINRHRQYAIAEGREVGPALAGSGAGALVVAGNYPVARVDYAQVARTSPDAVTSAGVGEAMVSVQPEPAEQPVDAEKPAPAATPAVARTEYKRGKRAERAERPERLESPAKPEKRRQARPQQPAAKPVKVAAPAAASPPPRKWQTVSASAPQRSSFGSSGGTYTWPGDR